MQIKIDKYREGQLKELAEKEGFKIQELIEGMIDVFLQAKREEYSEVSKDS